MPEAGGMGGGWGAAIGAGAGMLGGSAAQGEALRQQGLNAYQNAAQQQVGGWEQQQNDADLAGVQRAYLQRLGGYNTLSQALSPAQREAALRTGRQGALTRQDAALAGVPGNVARTNVGAASSAAPGGVMTRWGQAANAQLYQPAMDANRNWMQEQVGQGAIARQDTRALDANANREVTTQRQLQEGRGRSQALAARRAYLLAQAGVQNMDRGPGAAYYDRMLGANAANTAAAGFNAYGAYQNRVQPVQPSPMI
jgi:hypothetical protein